MAWLRDRVRLAPAEAKRQIRLASGLEHRDVTRQALGSGAFPVASAEVIMRALDVLPADIDASVVGEAELYLAGEAHAHDTQALRRLAAHLDEVIDPEGADQRLAEQLARAEVEAARQCLFTLRHDEANAVTDGVFRVPLLQGVKLQRMLESLTNPARPDAIESVDPETGVQVSAGERRGRAFAQLIDRIPTKKLPKLGGSDPTVVVTMSFDALLRGLQAAHLDTGQAISPGQARRLAAHAGVIPAVLGSSTTRKAVCSSAPATTRSPTTPTTESPDSDPAASRSTADADPFVVAALSPDRRTSPRPAGRVTSGRPPTTRC